MDKFIKEHKPLLIIASIAITASLIIVLLFYFLQQSNSTNTAPEQLEDSEVINYDLNDTDMDTTGGPGEPTAAELVLSNWEIDNGQGVSLSMTVPIDTQNKIVAAITADLTSQYNFEELIIFGSITEASYDRATSTQLFTVEVEGVVYEVSIFNGMISIKERQTERNVAV